MTTAASPCTRDALWGGRLVLWQPARGQGYRFNLDPVLLAHFATGGEHVVDFGAGCGVVGLLMLALGKAQRVTAVELQPDLAQLAQRNAAENCLSDRFTVLCGDLRTAEVPRGDAVVFNPPYYPLGSSRASPDVGRDWARREHHGTLADFARLALRTLEPQGRAAAIVPAARASELQGHFRRMGAHLHRRRVVVPRAHGPTQHVLLEAGHDARPFYEEPPLPLHVGEGRDFSDEVGDWVAGPASPRLPPLPLAV